MIERLKSNMGAFPLVQSDAPFSPQTQTNTLTALKGNFNCGDIVFQSLLVKTGAIVLRYHRTEIRYAKY